MGQIYTGMFYKGEISVISYFGYFFCTTEIILKLKV